jgi:glutamate racemase
MLISEQDKTPIAIFDSGYGGLTVLERIRTLLPDYDYIYLGDNARNPYGTRSFEIVYQYTLQAVKKLIDMGAPLTILACNTASAKALRTIQQNDLPRIDASLRVLGVIRPSVEAIGHYTKTKHIGIFGTPGTVNSESYPIEIAKLWADVKVFQQACPMWVPLVENGEYDKEGADYFVKKYVDQLMAQSDKIDTIILACTHYPLLIDKIRQYLPPYMNILSQGDIVALSLKDYLSRHVDIETKLSKGGTVSFYTTENVDKFESTARIFFDEELSVNSISL